MDRSRELLADRGRYNSTEKIWRLDDGRTLEFGAVQYEQDVGRYRGRPHDLIAFDEATEFSEFQVRFLLGWLRTTVKGQRCRVVLTFNPPTTTEGEWVLRFFAPWLDPAHPNPALPGELRWFAMVDGHEVERPDSQPFEHAHRDGRVETIRPQSRTFFPAKLEDNPVLAATEYGTTLQALPEPLRSQLLYGDFSAGLKPDAWQVIPTAWAKAAQARWTPEGRGDAALSCLGMDVAHGGRDKTVIARRYGAWFAPLAKYPGHETPTGTAAAALAALLWEKGAFANVDAIGYGASACERLHEDWRYDALPVNFAAGSEFKDRSGKFPMRNLRAEAYWRLREALDPEGDELLALPPDPELLADLTAYKFKITPSGIQIESKEEVYERIRRSTDCGDAVALALLPAYRQVTLREAAEIKHEPIPPGQRRREERPPFETSRRDRIESEGIGRRKRNFYGSR